jgi:hypothetical protein
MRRRDALRRLLTLAGSSPLLAQQMTPGRNVERRETIYPPSYSEEVMGAVNLHEFEPIAKGKIHQLAYDFIAGGVEDEITLRENREALERLRLRPRVMVDVSGVDPSVELLGQKLEYPILLAPTGGKDLVVPDDDLV